MPAGAVKTPEDEKNWQRAKDAAAKQGQAGNYRLIMHIFKQMQGSKSLYPDEQTPDLRKVAKAEADEAKIRAGLKKQASKHRRLAEEHRRANPKGGGTMGRWRQERAHDDAQEAHREAAETSEEAITDTSKRDEAQDTSDAAFTHPPAEEVKSMESISKSEYDALPVLEKAKYKQRYRGPGGEWRYVYDESGKQPREGMVEGFPGEWRRDPKHGQKKREKRQQAKKQNRDELARRQATLAGTGSAAGLTPRQQVQTAIGAQATMRAARQKDAAVLSAAQKISTMSMVTGAETKQLAQAAQAIHGLSGARDKVRALAREILASKEPSMGGKAKQLAKLIQTTLAAEKSMTGAIQKGLRKAFSKPAEKDPKKDPKAKPTDEEDEANEPGSHDHHKDRALAHLQAAQAHATAAHSAKKVEAAKEHKQVVDAAEQASQAAVSDTPDGKEPVAKGGFYGDNLTRWADQFMGNAELHEQALKLVRDRMVLDAQRPKWADTAESLKARQAHEAKSQKLRDEMDAVEKRYLDFRIKEAETRNKMSKSGPTLVRPEEDIGFHKSQIVHHHAEDAVLEHLEGGAVIGGQLAGLRHDGRSRLLGMRGERMTKGGVAGGTVYQGEHNAPRGGDMRETVARAQSYAETVQLDPDETRGQGGLPEWWEDAWHENPEVKVPVGLEGSRGFAKGQTPAVNVIDDSDPVTKAHRSDVNRVGLAVEMRYHGDGRETRRDGR